jgi:hypothetical protein
MKFITDSRPAVEKSYLKTFLFRSDHMDDDITIIDWITLTLIEFMFGEELLEQLVITASYSSNSLGKSGRFLHISNMIPSGFLTNIFRQKISQLLYYKFYQHYLCLVPEEPIDGRSIRSDNITESKINLSRERFSMRHDLLYQVIAFRRVYILLWVVLNLSIDIIIFLNFDLQAALTSALTIEGIRRMLRL